MKRTELVEEFIDIWGRQRGILLLYYCFDLMILAEELN